MTFHEADLSKYNGGVIGNIIGYGSLAGIVGLDAMESYKKAWDGRAVAPEWDGAKGNVCIDGVTSIDGYGGAKLRDAMKADFKANSKKYRNFGAGNANPNQAAFFRPLAWLVQFFKNTNRYADLHAGKRPDGPLARRCHGADAGCGPRAAGPCFRAAAAVGGRRRRRRPTGGNRPGAHAAGD